MVFTSITATEADAESPLDDNLFSKIKDNFDDHESRILGVKSWPYDFKIDGPLSLLVPQYGRYRRLAGSSLLTKTTISKCNLNLEVPGSSGTLEIDIRKHSRLNVPIASILRLFSASINSITQIAPALATQSISRATSTISTQSITLWKTAINISSIILLGNNLARINLASAPDSDYKVGDRLRVAGAPSGANNGDWVIVRVNDDGANNVVVTNAAAVAQTTASGTAVLVAFAYNFTNPVSAEFVAGEVAAFAAHTAGANNGAFTIYAVNQGGNNVIVKNTAGVAQGSVAGTADVNRWVYTFTVAASTTDFVAGENALMASHTAGCNNGSFRITAVNQGGNNVVVYNTAGVAQGSVAGTVNTNRWVYALSSDPTNSFSVGQSAIVTGATNANNNGTFSVRQINRLGTNNIVVYNTAGVTQAGAAGTLAHSRMIVSFFTNQSASITTASSIEFFGVVSTNNYGYFDVLEVNRGGGSNFNVVVDIPAGVEQLSPAGRVHLESKSLFVNRPKIVFPTTGEASYNNAYMQVVQSVSGDFTAEATISDADIAAGRVVSLDIISLPTGNPSDLTVQLT